MVKGMAKPETLFPDLNASEMPEWYRELWTRMGVRGAPLDQVDLTRKLETGSLGSSADSTRPRLVTALVGEQANSACRCGAMAPSSGGDRGLRPTCAFERWMKKELRALAQIGEADLIPLWGRRHGEQSLKQIVQRAFVKDERTGRDVTSWCAETNFGKLGAGRRSRRLCGCT